MENPSRFFRDILGAQNTRKKYTTKRTSPKILKTLWNKDTPHNKVADLIQEAYDETSKVVRMTISYKWNR